MKSIDLVKKLDNKSNDNRREIITDYLKEYQVDYRTQEYTTGINVIVDLGAGDKRIGISSHFDVVPGAPGANDNAAAMAVCLDIIRRFHEKRDREKTDREKGDPAMGIRIFFFDEEETGLKGSSAYAKQYGVKDMTGLINLELVGIGDKLAIWPVNQDSSGSLLEKVEQCSKARKIETRRFDKIITNTADHLSFRTAGLADAFTLTCISDKDIEVAARYYRAMQENVSTTFLLKILSEAPIFENYHQPGDSYKIIKEQSILMTADVVWDTLLAIRKGN